MMPASDRSKRSTHRPVSTERYSTTSKSLTSVSAMSTNVWASSLSRCGIGHRLHLLDSESSRDHVVSNIADRPVFSVGPRSEAYERVGDADVEEGRDHPRGLMDLGAQRLRIRELRGEPTAGNGGLQVEQCVRDQVGDDQRGLPLVDVQVPGELTLQIERAEADGAETQWEREDGADARLEDGLTERRPSRRRRVHQVGLCHGSAAAVRVDAGPFTQRELELLDQGAARIG